MMNRSVSIIGLLVVFLIISGCPKKNSSDHLSGIPDNSNEFDIYPRGETDPPSWYVNLPKSSSYLYAVGLAENVSSEREAERIARNDALNKIAGAIYQYVEKESEIIHDIKKRDSDIGTDYIKARIRSQVKTEAKLMGVETDKVVSVRYKGTDKVKRLYILVKYPISEYEKEKARIRKNIEKEYIVYIASSKDPAVKDLLSKSNDPITVYYKIFYHNYFKEDDINKLEILKKIWDDLNIKTIIWKGKYYLYSFSDENFYKMEYLFNIVNKFGKEWRGITIFNEKDGEEEIVYSETIDNFLELIYYVFSNDISLLEKFPRIFRKIYNDYLNAIYYPELGYLASLYIEKMSILSEKDIDMSLWDFLQWNDVDLYNKVMSDISFNGFSLYEKEQYYEFVNNIINQYKSDNSFFFMNERRGKYFLRALGMLGEYDYILNLDMDEIKYDKKMAAYQYAYYRKNGVLDNSREMPNDSFFSLLLYSEMNVSNSNEYKKIFYILRDYLSSDEYTQGEKMFLIKNTLIFSPEYAGVEDSSVIFYSVNGNQLYIPHVSFFDTKRGKNLNDGDTFESSLEIKILNIPDIIHSNNEVEIKVKNMLTEEEYLSSNWEGNSSDIVLNLPYHKLTLSNQKRIVLGVYVGDLLVRTIVLKKGG